LGKLAAACSAFLFLQTVTAQLPLMAVAADQVRVMERARLLTVVVVLGAGAQPFVFQDQEQT
jgi:hypothetical protein